MTYTPLDSDTLFSSVMWLGPDAVGVWYSILASKDQDGVTALNPHTLANIMRCDVAVVQAAWDKLAAPDPDSHNTEHEGRRIVPTKDGNWFVVSHQKYRDKHSGAAYRERGAVRKRRQREREAQDPPEDDQATIPHETPSQASVAVAVTPPVPPKPRGNPTVAACCDIWNERYGKKTAVGGKIAGAIAPLLDSYTHEEITGALRRYLAETTHPAPSPGDFREHLKDWLPDGKGAGRSGPRAVVRDVEQENRESLARIKAKREGNGSD